MQMESCACWRRRSFCTSCGVVPAFATRPGRQMPGTWKARRLLVSTGDLVVFISRELAFEMEGVRGDMALTEVGFSRLEGSDDTQGKPEAPPATKPLKPPKP